MTVLDARASLTGFDMSDIAHATMLGLTGSMSDTYHTYNTAAGGWLTASGTGFVYQGGSVTNGTITGLAYDTDKDGVTDVTFSDFQMWAPRLGLQAPAEFWARLISGNDTLYSTSGGHDVMFGDAAVTLAGQLANFGGHDRIFVSGSAFGTFSGDWLESYNAAVGGNDRIVSTSTRGSLLIGDVLTNNAGEFFGGNDRITVNQASIAGPQQFNTLIGDAQTIMPNAIFTGGNDILTGSSAARDFIYGDAFAVSAATGSNFGAIGGSDTLYGRNGADTLVGDFGTVAPGSDPIHAGSDFLYGGQGADKIYGDFDSLDTSVTVIFGDDSIEGGVGNDIIYGDYHQLTGDPADLSHFLTSGSDLISGGAGNDLIFGQIGHDQLNGDAGDDSIDGGSGYDQLRGGAGTDVLTGGSEGDVFYFDPGSQIDIITDFEFGIDAVNLQSLALGDLQTDVLDHATAVGLDVQIDLGSGDVLILQNMTLASLGLVDFII